MKKIMLQTILLCCLCLASCSDSEENRPVLPPDQEQEEPETPDRPHDYTELISKTSPVPAVYEQEAEQRGEVVRIDYDTHDYAEARVLCAQIRLMSICPTATKNIPTDVTTCFILYTGITARQLRFSKMRTACCASYSTT